jgi:hypothetical protein
MNEPEENKSSFGEEINLTPYTVGSTFGNILADPVAAIIQRHTGINASDFLERFFGLIFGFIAATLAPIATNIGKKITNKMSELLKKLKDKLDDKKKNKHREKLPNINRVHLETINKYIPSVESAEIELKDLLVAFLQTPRKEKQKNGTFTPNKLGLKLGLQKLHDDKLTYTNFKQTLNSSEIKAYLTDWRDIETVKWLFYKEHMKRKAITFAKQAIDFLLLLKNRLNLACYTGGGIGNIIGGGLGILGGPIGILIGSLVGNIVLTVGFGFIHAIIDAVRYKRKGLSAEEVSKREKELEKFSDNTMLAGNLTTPIAILACTATCATAGFFLGSFTLPFIGSVGGLTIGLTLGLALGNGIGNITAPLPALPLKKKQKIDKPITQTSTVLSFKTRAAALCQKAFLRAVHSDIPKASILGGTLSSLLGLAVGSAIPGIGTALGGIAGGIIGTAAFAVFGLAYAFIDELVNLYDNPSKSTPKKPEEPPDYYPTSPAKIKEQLEDSLQPNSGVRTVSDSLAPPLAATDNSAPPAVMPVPVSTLPATDIGSSTNSIPTPANRADSFNNDNANNLIYQQIRCVTT